MTERRPYYTMLQKILAARVPVATFSGGIHRIDFTVDEYAELRRNLFEPDDADGEHACTTPKEE